MAQEGLPRHVVERELIGTDHAELGAWLLGQWGLPSAVLDAVQRHHQVALAGEITLDATVAVAIANRLAHHVDQFAPGTAAANPSLVAAGDPRWPWWRELAEHLALDGMAV